MKTLRKFFDKKISIPAWLLIISIGTIIAVVLVIAMGVLGIRVTYNPSLEIDWSATAAIGTILGAIATTIVGTIALYIAKQSNDLVKTQENNARKELLLQEVEKTVYDVNYIARGKFLYTNVKEIQFSNLVDIKSIYLSEVKFYEILLSERQLRFNTQEIVELNNPYYNLAYNEIGKTIDTISAAETWGDLFKTLVEKDTDELKKFILMGEAFILDAEIKLFGNEIHNRYPNKIE